MSDIPKCWTKKVRKARKDHKCCECRGVIKAGENYHYFSGVWDDPAQFKTCPECEVMREELFNRCDNEDDYVAFRGLAEWIFESHDKALMSRYIETRRKRGAPVPQWMAERMGDE